MKCLRSNLYLIRVYRLLRSGCPCSLSMSVNGVYIVMGETNTVVALLNKARRYVFQGKLYSVNFRQYQLSHQPPSLEDTDPLMRNFADLKEVLNSVRRQHALNH